MNGKIFIISGPSGVGKDTIVRSLRAVPELNLGLAKSYTTRDEREDDKVESKYMFISPEEFEDHERTGEIFESNYYHNAWYGSSRKENERAHKEGFHILKDVDVNGGKAYRELFPNSVLIFVAAEIEEIKNRLMARGQHTLDQIAERLEIAREEFRHAPSYHHIVENKEGRLQETIDHIASIIKKYSEKELSLEQSIN